MTWWWLSFADPDKPRGQQFLGVAVVNVPASATEPKRGLRQAMTLCHALGINPGGCVDGSLLGDTVPAGLPTRRLLTKAEAQHWGDPVVWSGGTAHSVH